MRQLFRTTLNEAVVPLRTRRALKRFLGRTVQSDSASYYRSDRDFFFFNTVFETKAEIGDAPQAGLASFVRGGAARASPIARVDGCWFDMKRSHHIMSTIFKSCDISENWQKT